MTDPYVQETCLELSFLHGLRVRYVLSVLSPSFFNFHLCLVVMSLLKNLKCCDNLISVIHSKHFLEPYFNALKIANSSSVSIFQLFWQMCKMSMFTLALWKVWFSLIMFWANLIFVASWSLEDMLSNSCGKRMSGVSNVMDIASGNSYFVYFGRIKSGFLLFLFVYRLIFQFC